MVIIKDTLSDPEEVKMGVPQGTVLGPILFIVYINSLFTTQVNGTVISYADDTVFEDQSWENVKTKAQLDFHKLSLNISKTTFIAF